MVKPGNRRPVGKKSAGSIAVAIFVALYVLLQPRLNEQFGWSLPGLGQQTHSAAPVDSQAKLETAAASDVAAKNADDVDVNADDVDVADADNVADDNRSKSARQSTPAVVEVELIYGLLTEIGRDQFQSPQGLRYLPGSAEGHRLEHLRRHTVDDPSRPGKHGVFDGGMEGALATIDQAYERAKNEQRTTTEIDRDRTIYTVDLGRRVGYVGGVDGKRSRNPMARRVKLVVEDSIFITAYPL